MINVFQPTLGDEELSAVAHVFKSNWLWAGKKVDEFKKKFAFKIGVDENHLITLSSCTDGLFLAFQLYLPRRVVMPSIHFVGAANAAYEVGCEVDFCDVSPVTLNPSISNIRRKHKQHTDAVCLLHYGGRPCDDIVEIADYCRDNRIALIEDSACSLDSYLNGKACGTFGDIGLWSFDAMKLLSCGDGGIMYIRDKAMLEKAKKLTFFGMTSKSGLGASESKQSRWWEFEVDDVYGRYSSMTDIDAAIMLKQLEFLPYFKKQRAMVDMIYRRCLSGIPELKLCPMIQPSCVHSYYFFWVQTDRRDDLAVFLKENGIYTTFRYHPLHKVEAYHHGWRKLPGAEKAADTTLLLPIHAALSIDEVTYICEKVREFFNDQLPKVAE